jgi:hypothetical protein
MAGAGSAGGGGSLGSDIATSELQDGAVTLAKMADLAQDLFIVRTTASTGVPQTATVTAAARTVLDDTTVAAMRTTLGCDDLYGQSINTRRRNYRSALSSNGTLLLTEDTAYFVYVGYTTEAVTPKHVKFAITTGGTGGQTAEVGLFSTPLAPNGTSQSLTKLVADGTLDDLTAGNAVKGNTSAMATQIAAGVHVWAGLRTAMATNEPTCTTLTRDYSRGEVLSTATAGALTGTGPWTGALITHSVSGQAPDLVVTLDA